MTYVLAWRTNAAVYVTTDTVKTVDGNYTVPVSQESTFFERHIIDHEHNHFVHEGIIKIFNIKDQIFYAFAGDVRLAYDIFETFQLALLNCEKDVRSAFDAALGDALPIEKTDEVAVVVGYVKDGAPTLLTYDRGEIKDNQTLVNYGSFTGRKDLIEQVEHQILQGINFVNAQQLAGQVDDRLHQTVLSRVNGLLQSIGIHNPLIDIGVGGVFVSAAVTLTNGFIWPRSNAYVLYPTKKPFQPVGAITVRYIDNIVFIAVNGSETVKAFVPGITMDQINAAFKKYAKENGSELALTANYIFLSTTFRHVFIVHKDIEYPDHWLRISRMNRQTWRAELSDGLKEKLFNENNPPAFIEELW